MANHSEGYQSLSSISREQRQRSSMAGVGGRQDGSAGGMASSDTKLPPLRKMVRMASEIFTPSNRPIMATRTSSGHHIPKLDYGTTSKTSPLRGPNDSAVADDDEATTVAGDDDDDDYQDQWGNWRLIMLTIGLAGAQLAWTIELGYGTPYLLSLGLSKELTSLVWLAGPISGFVVQPIIGALSDNSSSRYRRRRWVVYTTTLITVSALMLAFASELATGLVDTFNRGQGDWDPKRNADIRFTAIGIAVLAFYILDFSLNGAQAALRALVLDLVPSDQQTMANAYLARMANIGNIVGYGFGFINLTSSVLLRWIGGGQFRKLCILSVTVLDICVIITCVMNPEERLPKIKRDKSLKKVFSNILAAARDLPVPIRRVCYVQLCGFSGLFSTMFYSTTWVGARYKLQYPEHPPSDDTATRAGSLALLFQSIVAVVTSLLLPIVQSIGSSEYILSRPPTRGWNALRYSLSLWTPRNLWTFSYIWFVLVIGSTFFVSTHEEAIIVIAALGISITIIGWIPFAILMEFIREMEAGAELNGDVVISAAEVAESMLDGVEGRGGESYLSVPGTKQRARRQSKASSIRSRRSSIRSNRSGRQRVAKAVGECRPLLEGDEEEQAPQKTEGGTILGIHNLAIVSPQFITAIAASIIFKISELTEDSPYRRRHGIESGADVVWVLRYGGFVTIFAAIVSRWVPAAPSETIYVNELRAACQPQEDE